MLSGGGYNTRQRAKAEAKAAEAKAAEAKAWAAQLEVWAAETEAREKARAEARRVRRAEAEARTKARAKAARVISNSRQRIEFEVMHDVGETVETFWTRYAPNRATSRDIIDQHRALMQEETDKGMPAPKGAIRASSAAMRSNRSNRSKRGDQANQLVFGRGLAQILLRAYSNHCGVELTPDMLWGAFVTQLGFVVNANMRDLRSRLVSFQGKKKLEVEVRDVREGVAALQDAIRDQLAAGGSSELVDLLAAEFTTTTDASRVLNTIALMASMQTLFTYVISARCGLPRIVLLGTVEDWDSIAKRMRAVFRALPLPKHKAYNAWQRRIVRLAKQCARARRGRPNVLFWLRMVDSHNARRSGSMTTLTGWLPLTLCAFQSDGTPTEIVRTETNDDGTVTHHVDVTRMPFGCVSVPVTLKDWSGKRGTCETTMVAGIMAAQVRKGRDGRAWLTPRAHWYMANNKA